MQQHNEKYSKKREKCEGGLQGHPRGSQRKWRNVKMLKQTAANGF